MWMGDFSSKINVKIFDKGLGAVKLWSTQWNEITERESWYFSKWKCNIHSQHITPFIILRTHSLVYMFGGKCISDVDSSMLTARGFRSVKLNFRYELKSFFDFFDITGECIPARILEHAKKHMNIFHHHYHIIEPFF